MSPGRYSCSGRCRGQRGRIMTDRVAAENGLVGVIYHRFIVRAGRMLAPIAWRAVNPTAGEALSRNTTLNL